MENTGLEIIGIVALGYAFGPQAVVVALITMFVVACFNYKPKEVKTDNNCKEQLQQLTNELEYAKGQAEMLAIVTKKNLQKDTPANGK